MGSVGIVMTGSRRLDLDPACCWLLGTNLEVIPCGGGGRGEPAGVISQANGSKEPSRVLVLAGYNFAGSEAGAVSKIHIGRLPAAVTMTITNYGGNARFGL